MELAKVEQPAEIQQQSAAEMRAKIMTLEAAMMAMPEHQIEIETIHTFAPGIYMREIVVPKGAIITGKIQKTEYLNVFTVGEMTVATEDGVKRVKAPCTLRSMPGLKRAGTAHEESRWITVHHNPTNERNIEKLEAMLFADTFEDVPKQEAKPAETPVITHQGNPGSVYFASKRTFEDVIKALGLTKEQVQEETANERDQVALCSSRISVCSSPVHGNGIFARTPFKRGDFIEVARLGGKRTHAGRYCNHSGTPNSEMVMTNGGDVYLFATKCIALGEEILSDYYLNVTRTRSLAPLGAQGGC